MIEGKQKEPTREIDFLVSIIDAMEDMVRIVDTEGTVILSNRAMDEKMGNMTGHRCFDIWGTGKRCEECISQKVLEKGIPQKGQRFLNGSYYAVTAAPFSDATSEVKGVVEVFRDITPHVQLQNKLTRANVKMMHGIEMGKRLQFSILRKQMPTVSGYRFTTGFFPCEEIGGDIFDCFKMPDGRILLYVADVSGHGIMSAMLTVFLKQQIVSCAEVPGISPDQVFSKIFHLFQDLNADDSIYITAFLCILDPETGRFTYSNAGHSVMPMLRGRDGVRELFLPGMPICRWFDEPDFKKSEAVLEPDGRLFLFTDGIVGIHRRRSVKKQLMQALDMKEFNAEGFIEQVKGSYTGGRADDLTILICEH